MTRPRQVTFRQLVVHRPDAASPGRPAAARPVSGFEAGLRRRPAAAAQPATDTAGSAEPLPAPQSAPLHQPVDDGGNNGNDGNSSDNNDGNSSDNKGNDNKGNDKGGNDDGPPRASSPDHPMPAEAAPEPDWASALMPTPAGINQLLAHAIGPDKGMPAPGLIASVAQTIAGFCNERAVDDSEGWTVRMPLRADLLAHTTLELAISSYWLQLRFVTADPHAQRLISQHEDDLRRLLTGLLKRQRDITIAIAAQ